MPRTTWPIRSSVGTARHACAGLVEVRRQRWFVVAPAEGGVLVTGVFRAAEPRDLEAEGAFVVPPPGRRGTPVQFSPSMRVCVSARMADADEARSYRAWRRSKGGR